MKKLLLADDHQIILDGLMRIVEETESLEVVAQANDGQQVIDYVQKNEVDIVCMDIEMPVLDGIEVTRQLKAHFPAVKVMILSMYNRPQYIKELVKLNVDAYVKKDAGKLDFLLALEKLQAGETYFSQHFTQTLQEILSKKDESIKLTPREQEILNLLQKGKNTTDIAEELVISHHTVQTHRKHLLKKFKVDNTISLIEQGIKKGFLDF